MSELALIIEDDEDLADIFAEALHGVGFEREDAVLLILLKRWLFVIHYLLV